MAAKYDDLSAWEVFVTYAKTGSLITAGEVLDMQPSSVSRTIVALEKSLGQDLVVHNSRPMQLTDTGSKAFKRMESILQAHRNLIESFTSDTAALSGHIRFSAPPGFATRRLVPFLKKFTEHYPNIMVDIVTGLKEDDVAKGRCEVAVISGRPTHRGLVYMSRGRNIYLPVATPEYVARHGFPLTPADLRNHKVYVYSGPVRKETQALKRGEQEVPVILNQSVKMADVVALRTAVLDHLGIALDMPLVQIHEDLQSGALVPILPGWMREPLDCFVVTSYANWRIRRVRLFLEWYAHQMQAEFASYEKAVSGIVGLPVTREVNGEEIFKTPR